MIISGEEKKEIPILIVDDDKIALKVLNNTLIKAGFHVAAAKNGLEAIEVLKTNFFPVVITDWLMPVMDGIELCKAIRETAFEGYVYVLLLTTNKERSEIVKGIEAGADDYLVKPFNKSELLARIGTGLRVLRLEKELKKANNEIRILSETDPLTKCYNRGYITKHLPGELERSRRYKRPFSIILWDIDYFKKINDEYGHLAGDCVLTEFSGCLTRNSRQHLDWVARYGGEEFLMMLSETDIKGAEAVSERIRKEVEALSVDYNGKILKITASYGCTGIEKPGQAMDYEKLINSADMLLYKAKHGGRNQGVVALPDTII